MMRVNRWDEDGSRRSWVCTLEVKEVRRNIGIKNEKGLEWSEEKRKSIRHTHNAKRFYDWQIGSFSHIYYAFFVSLFSHPLFFTRNKYSLIASSSSSSCSTIIFINRFQFSTIFHCALASLCVVALVVCCLHAASIPIIKELFRQFHSWAWAVSVER